MTDRSLTILLVVAHLDDRSGLTLSVRDLATELHRRGHRPIVYGSRTGAIAKQLRDITIPVPDRLDAIGVQPDVIHGHNYFETMLALLHFPSSPGVFTCHGWASPKNQPPLHPRIRRFVPVDQTCRDRLVFEHGVAPESTEVHYNFVDMVRFAPRADLPARPSRAFVFGAKLDPVHLQLITEECERRAITLEVLGDAIGNPEIVLRDFDLVFARGRCALESMAVGAALVVCGREGMGPMATTQNFDELRQLNFGMRAFRAPVTREEVVSAIEAYNADDAMAVSRRVRAEASLDKAVTQMVATYAAVIEEHVGAVVDRRAEDLAIARYVAGLPEHLLQITTKLKRWREAEEGESPHVLVDQLRLVQRRAESPPLKAHELSAVMEALQNERTRVEQLHSELAQLQAAHGELQASHKHARQQLAALRLGKVRRLQNYLTKLVKPKPSHV